MGIYVPKSRCEYEARRSAADISTIIVLINVHLNLHGPLACRLYQDATAAAAFEPPSAESAAEHLKHRGAVSLRVIISESHAATLKLYRKEIIPHNMPIKAHSRPSIDCP